MSNPKVDPMRALMNARLATEDKNPSADFDALMNRYRQLVSQVEQQQQLITNLERDASSDPLTGLANRRTLEKELERSLSTARRYGRRHALLLVDLNDFKSINDLLGHATGDQVLRHVARLLRQNIRPTDIAARLGGDEFCVILNELRAIENAEARATDLANIITHTPCMGEQHTVQLSASVGFYVFGADDDAADIMARADASMYRHKPDRI